MSLLNRRENRLEQIQQMDPVTEHCQICYLLAGYEFPWDIIRSLELAMLKTYCVPSISQLLDRTGEFHHHTQKRYDDTGLLVAELLKWGYDSERGQESLRRINAIHGHYPISNQDFLYVLSTFIYEPIKWNERFGWRLFTEPEKLAIFYFWQAVGQRMQIGQIPANYDEFAQFNRDYEQKHFVYSDANRRVGESTLQLFLSWFPAWMRPWLRPCVYAMFDDLALAAFGWPQPSFLLRHLVESILKWRGYGAKLLLPRTEPDFFTDGPLRSYPHGYELKDLGPTWMLEKLNRRSPRSS